MVLSSNLGFPRVGSNRELKKALEAFWKGAISEQELVQTASELRKKHWKLQQDSGIDLIPSNDFSFYDHVLDMCCTLGCVPSRYNWDGETIDLNTYFSMARGCQKDGIDVTAMEMTKWFDTNYHFMVPEFENDQKFKLSSHKIFDEFQEALDLGVQTKPVILGPITFLTIGKPKYDDFDMKETLEKILPVYSEILSKLASLGATWVQIDEPILATDLEPEIKALFETAYQTLSNINPSLKILLATYFESLRENSTTAFSLDVDGLHLDLCRGPNQANTNKNNSEHLLSEALENIGTKFLSLGLIDGRNIWKNNLRASFDLIDKALSSIKPEQLILSPSSSLLHVPVDLENETKLDEELKNWLAFATQKIKEIGVLKEYAVNGEESVSQALQDSDQVQNSRKTSLRINNEQVQSRVKNISEDMKNRNSAFNVRQEAQRPSLNLPAYPTTSIGSFPQTSEIRKARAAFKRGDIDQSAYKDAMKKEIQTVVEYQHEIGMDVLVHGEPERNDMVEYFGEQLSGFAFTKNGWVQSYGSRCVKPPIIFGDISRPEPMTVEWAVYAQSLTEKVMKGMLTGPITILQWSFVRDDQPRNQTSRQIALAIRDEVEDLEKAGIKIIQIDEAAIREGLPLRKEDWKAYLDNAVEDFRIASCVVQDHTQIHTHMCYSEFNDIIDSIANMDADVISIETSRSQMELLDAFVQYKYPNEIGPGVYDIHSPRVPTQQEILDLLAKAEKVLKADQIWVNPDCGLKTRGWEEVKPALKNMVEAAKTMRQKQKSAAA
jgi:5-methyltetrahydropteroyltriglutamate--homocysteine methyltransferase